ncbi:MAG: hypothetical protein H0X30_37165 [Anaerolineae bacterium]|nr:hypothetical protein [Anaerolineae bacterium]
MPKLEPTPEIIENILSRIPEGFIRYDMLCQRVALHRDMLAELINDKVGRDGDWWYDNTRLTRDEMHEQRKWAKPYFPEIKAGVFTQESILERMAERQGRIDQLGSTAQHMFDTLAQTKGYMRKDELCKEADDEVKLNLLLASDDLEQFEGLIYDPLRLSNRSIKQVEAQEKLAPARQAVTDYLTGQAGQVAPETELIEKFGAYTIDALISFDVLKTLQVMNPQHQGVTWLRLSSADPEQARTIATESTESSWKNLLDKCGKVIRPGIKDGKTVRMQVLARTYTVTSAAQRIGVRQNTLERAIEEDRIEAFEDPEGRLRLPADAVEAAFDNPEYAEHITAYEPVSSNDLAIVLDTSFPSVRRRLQKIGLRRGEPHWGDLRGEMDLPDTYREFRAILKEKTETFREQREQERESEDKRLEVERKEERERRNSLRAKLVAAFPTWRHDGRSEQRIILHVGPPNSGKTYQALQALKEAGSGWYLAPLRLLAFEIFDRLNQQGVFCNLLTGEEHVPILDAGITAATVEMFNPQQSGRCVIIDEAQMLADADRGWAWTRALMESRSADIHVIGPETVRSLIVQMATAAAIPLEIIEHERLAPIQIAEHSWPLQDLPPRTILVAFSRQLVLHLKTELERMKRTVSVVYGNLPPEVRRKQADRFANGETEICIATDAVGMGLNLPADYVCFYEIEKYDGRNVRLLTAAEVQQIGGRAGRYGLSTVGEIGATSKRDLKVIRQLFAEQADVLTHARVAPTVEDLELIPGSLASKLTQWSSLGSIPDSLRSAIQTADMSERIELANMLTDREVTLLGLEAALKIVNAPTRQSTRDYWYQCARHILTDKALPLPPVAPSQITNTIELESIEYCVSCADIYLWLSQRREFGSFAPHGDEVREIRTGCSLQIDGALLRKINTMKRCSRCGAPLSIQHRFNICDNCFRGRTPINHSTAG